MEGQVTGGGFESPRDVDTARDDLADGRFDVQSRNGFARADAVASHDVALQGEAAVQQAAGECHLANCDVLANGGTQYHFAPVTDG